MLSLYKKTPRPFKRAVNQLLVNLDTLKTNEPINRRSGNIKLAESERLNSKSIEAAIERLATPWRNKV